MRALIAAALVAAFSLPTAAQDVGGSGSVVTVLQADGRFETLVLALEAANLTDVLSEPGPFTVFAPTDSAFAALPDGVLEGLSPEDLQGILLGHVVIGAVSSADAAEAGLAPTAWGDGALTFELADGVLTVDGVAVEDADLVAPNGVVHVIGAVLLPADAAPDGVDELDGGIPDPDGETP